MEIRPIAHIRTDFPEKFGIPRQSGLVEELEGTIIFEKEYRNPDATRGLEQYTHIWLLWEFSDIKRDGWTPTVRPPRLGGNTRMGVFATRSPYRPNPIGMSVVRLAGIERDTPDGDVIKVLGADLLDGTPIFDIKPYLPYVDSKPEASNGFALSQQSGTLTVHVPQELIPLIPSDKIKTLKQVLSQDPRPQYQDDPERVYTMSFSTFDVGFKVENNTLNVISIKNLR